MKTITNYTNTIPTVVFAIIMIVSSIFGNSSNVMNILTWVFLGNVIHFVAIGMPYSPKRVHIFISLVASFFIGISLSIVCTVKLIYKLLTVLIILIKNKVSQ